MFKGYYVYIETSPPTLSGWKAQLASEPLLDPNEGCVYFWYHMLGAVWFIFYIVFNMTYSFCVNFNINVISVSVLNMKR